MPVYHVTLHTYRSWRPDDPDGFYNKERGWHAPSKAIAAWRDEHATQPPVRLDTASQEAVHALLVEWSIESQVRLYAAASTPTHIHHLISLEEPPCTCDDATRCLPACPASQRSEELTRRVKQLIGYRLAKHTGEPGRKWLSSGWDITPVRDREHFDELVFEYFPKHGDEAGIVRTYWK